MLSCLGWSSSAAVAPVASVTASPPPSPVLPPAPLCSSAPLADLSSADPAQALAAARGLCERTGGAGGLEERMEQLGGESSYEAACMAEVAAGAQQHLLACLAGHDKCIPILECVAHCVRSLCMGEVSTAGHRRALFPAFAPLAAAAAWLATSGGAGCDQAANAAWQALGSLVLYCTESQYATALLCVPAAVSALSACAARQGPECCHAASFLTALFTTAAYLPQLHESAHAACHVCLPPLLAVLRCGSAEATAEAALALLSLPVLRPCALYDLIAPSALPAVAEALTRHCTSGRTCKLLVDLLRRLKWGDCSCHADVQLAVSALLACLECKALVAGEESFGTCAVLALGDLDSGSQHRHWRGCLFEQAFGPLAALLNSALCRHSARAAGLLCYTLGMLVSHCTTLSQLSCAASAAPAVMGALMVHQRNFYALSGAASFLESVFRAAKCRSIQGHWIFGAHTFHWRGFTEIQATLLPHMPVLLRALAKVSAYYSDVCYSPLVIVSVCRSVSKVIAMAVGKCIEHVACPHCKALQAACLSAAPVLVDALGAVTAHGDNCNWWAWAGVDLANAVSALAAHCSGAERSALVVSALDPLVEVISVYSSVAFHSVALERAVDCAALALCAFVEEGARSARGSGSATAADAEAVKAELHEHHVPALRAASDRLQSPPPHLQRLLVLLGVHTRLLLVHMPPPEAALRLRSCLECWRAAPRRVCPDARAHGEQLECAICRADEGDATAAEASMVALHCGHVFHMQCLMGWVKAQRAREGSMCCPLDMAPVTQLAEAAEGGQDAPGCTPIEEAAVEAAVEAAEEGNITAAAWNLWAED